MDQNILLKEIKAKKHLKTLSSKGHAVRCQVHGEPVVVDCKLSKCVFHTQYPKVNNCILVYMAKQDVDSLKAIDIGMLKKLPAQKVARDLTKATIAMRNSTLRISNQVDLEPKFHTVLNLDVCYACEAPVSQGRARKNSLEFHVGKDKGRVAYCSPECAEQHPPPFVAAEIECRTDIKTITEWAVKKYSTLGGLEQALGMNRALLGSALKRLLNLDAEEIYATTQRVKTRSKALVRRTGSRPEWLSQFSDLIKPMVAQMEKRHGRPTLDLSYLSKEVQKVIDSI